MVMIGTARPSGGGVAVDVAFLDPGASDTLPVNPFTVADDGKHREAAQQITADLEEGVEYTRSLVYCGDYLSSGQLEDAMRNCERALAINLSSIRGRYLRGRIHMERERWEDAAQDLDYVVTQSPSNTDALESLAYTHTQLGNQARSLELYQDYLRFNPDDPRVRLNVAYELAKAGAYGEAMAILQEGVERDPENSDLWEYLGSVALAHGTDGGAEGEDEVTHPEAVRVAVDAFAKVLSLRGEKTDPSILSNAIVANMLLGDHQAALDFADRAIGLIENPPVPDPEVVEEDTEGPRMSREELLASIHSRRAEVYSRMERFEDAADAITEAMRYDPELDRGYMRRAVFKLQGGDPDGAITDFRTAVDRGADTDEIANRLFSRGYFDHFEQEQFGRALQLFRMALEFAQAPDVSHRIHLFAAWSYFQRGTAIDNANEEAEACEPARNALSNFQQVLPHLNQAGRYQPDSQAQIRDAVDVQLYRQEQIIRKACR